MIPENLRPIPGFLGYYITNDGKIFSNRKYKKLVKIIGKEDKDGYMEIGLYKNKKRYFRRIHRLVLEAWSSNPNNYTQVNHIDGNKKNNHISNLEWCTCEYNINHSFKVLNRKPTISTNKKVILTNKRTNESKMFFSIKECAKYLGISYEHLGRILSTQYDINKSRKLKFYSIQYEV